MRIYLLIALVLALLGVGMATKSEFRLSSCSESKLWTFIQV